MNECMNSYIPGALPDLKKIGVDDNLSDETLKRPCVRRAFEAPSPLKNVRVFDVEIMHFGELLTETHP